MRLLGVVAILAILGVLLVFAGTARVDTTIGPANAGPAPVADAKPVVARWRPEVRGLLEDRDKDTAAGLFLLIGMFEGRRGR